MAQVQTATTTTVAEGAIATAGSSSVVSARILKKRETDRRCQRMIRERTKSRIAYLEDLVEQFRQQDPSGRVETLMQQLSDMKDERDTLAKQVKNIESIISGNSKLKEEIDEQDLAIAKIRPSCSQRTSSLSIDTDRALQIQPSLHEELTSVSPQGSPIYQIYNEEFESYVESSARSSWSASTLQPGAHQPCECSSHYPVLDPTKTLNKWRYANDTLTEWFKWSPQALNMSKYMPYNDDIPVRAIVEGWDVVEKQGNMHPAWRLLRGIDQTLFITCDSRERLAILQVMGWLLTAHINPTTEQQKRLPSFYLKRPSQDMLHSYATEYFAWPGLRERFVFGEHRYCSNIFWKLFCKALRVQWAYEFRDCYVRNIDTGLYGISPTFHDCISDIRSWTMDMDMFKQYPELYGDIPAWNHVPASVGTIRHNGHRNRRALPSISAVQDAKNKKQDNEQQQAQMQISTQLHTPMSIQHQLLNHDQITPLQTSYHQYPPSVSGSFEPEPTPVPGYDFPQMVTIGAEVQHTAPMKQWGYPGSLDMFHMNPV